MNIYYKRLSKAARTLVSIISAMFIIQLAFLIHVQVNFMLSSVIIANVLVVIGFIWSLVYVLDPGARSQLYFKAMVITLCSYIVLDYIVFPNPYQTMLEKLVSAAMFGCLIAMATSWKDYCKSKWYSYAVILSVVLKSALHTIIVLRNGNALASLRVDLFGLWSFAILTILVMICFNDRLKIKIEEQSLQN